MIEDLNELITAALTDLFRDMLHMEIARVPIESSVIDGQSHIAGAVGFIGRATGVIYVHTTTSFARRMTATLLQLTEVEVEGDEMVNDAVGEITNMLVGHVKSRLSDRGMPCVLTIPSVVRGNHFSIEAISSTKGRLLSFEAEGKRIFVQCLLKPNDRT
jgi:chemotaxis protein CheX